MIVEVILNFFKTVVGALLTPFQLVFQPLGSMAGFVELLSYASVFVPITVFVQCIGLWLAYHTFKFGMILINWLIAKIPTIS